MASKISRQYTASIQGVVDIQNNAITIQVEGKPEPIDFKKFIEDFNGMPVKISIVCHKDY